MQLTQVTKEAWAEHFKRLNKLTVRGQRPYAPNWGKICFKVRKACGNRCVNCWKRAELVHHLYYATLRDGWLYKFMFWLNPTGIGIWQKVYGYEKGGISCVPLCKDCHGIVHREISWFRHEINPDFDCNYEETANYLRACYWQLVAYVEQGKIKALE